MTRDEIISYINNSTIEKDINGNTKGLYTQGGNSFIQFMDESTVLYFHPQYKIRNIDRRTIKHITEIEFFAYLNILMDMDKLRQDRISLRKLILNEDIQSYIRDEKMKQILGN